MEDEVVLIVGSDHALAGSEEIDRETLAGLKFVSLHRSSTVQGIKASLEQHGIDWKTLRTVMVCLDSSYSAACILTTCPYLSLSGCHACPFSQTSSTCARLLRSFSRSSRILHCMQQRQQQRRGASMTKGEGKAAGIDRTRLVGCSGGEFSGGNQELGGGKPGRGIRVGSGDREGGGAGAAACDSHPGPAAGAHAAVRHRPGALLQQGRARAHPRAVRPRRAARAAGLLPAQPPPAARAPLFQQHACT